MILALVAAALGYWGYSRLSRTAKTAAVVVRTAKARIGNLNRTLRLTGVTTAEKSAFLMVPQLIGTRSRGSSEFQQVLQKLVPSGTYVRKGTVLAEFDSLYMFNRLQDYRAYVAQQGANLRSLNAILRMRRDTYRQTELRYRGARDKAILEMKKNPVLSYNAAERNRLNVEQTKAQHAEIAAEAEYFEISEKASIRRSELVYQVSQMELARAEKNVEKMTVRSPIDGIVVVQTFRRSGQYSEIREGDQLHPGQTFLQVVDISSMAVNATANQVDIEELRIGQKARVLFDAYPGLEMPARVVAVGLMARASGWRGTYVKTVPVRLKLDGRDSRVIPNYSVSADVVLGSVHDAIVVPRESIFTDSGSGKPYAFVRSPSGWVRRDVELGLANNISVAVRSGLNEGDEIALDRPAERSAYTIE